MEGAATVLYLASDQDGQLRQGEVIEAIRELRFNLTNISEETIGAQSLLVDRVDHPWTIVLSPDCDLDWDFKARMGLLEQPSTKRISHVLLCDLEDESALRAERVTTSKNRALVKENRDERYHFIPSGEVENASILPEFYVDFKRVFALPADYIYAVAESNLVTRHGFLKVPWVQHLAHRFTYFLGRVALPDSE